jgi:DNA-binding beta-propeller fold protein YncE
MAAPPIALTVDRASSRIYVADRSGLIWTLEDGEPILNPPVSCGAEPTGLAVDEQAGRLYVAVRSSPMVVVLENPGGRRAGTVALPSPPGEVQLDAERRLLYVLLPQDDALAVVNVDALKIDHVVPQLPRVTTTAFDADSHALYLSHQSGELSVFDGLTATVTERLKLTDIDLSGAATANGEVYAVSSATQELVALDPISHAGSRSALVDEPIAIAAANGSGDVFILAAQPPSIVRFDASTGMLMSRLALPEDIVRPATLTFNPADETLYVASANAAMLLVIPPQAFP